MTITSMNVLTVGLDASLEDELRPALAASNFELISASVVPDRPSDAHAAIFCRPDMLGIVQELSQHCPVVVVSRSPDCGQWLDALEAGAADYCSTPVEPRQLQWILDGVARVQRAA